MVCTPEPAGTWPTLLESSTSPRGPLMLMLSQRLTTDMAMDIPTMDWDILATGTDTPPAPTTMARGPLMLSLSLTMDTALSDTTDSDMEATDTATPGPTMVDTATTARGLLMPRLTLPTKWLPVTMWPMPTPLDTPTTWESSPESLTATTASPPTLDMDTLTLVNFLLTK